MEGVVQLWWSCQIWGLVVFYTNTWAGELAELALGVLWWADGAKKVWNWCLNLFSWSSSMWKWCPVFTVRDLAPLSSRWSHPASESPVAPQPRSLPLFSSLISSSFPSSMVSVIQLQPPPPAFMFLLLSLNVIFISFLLCFFFLSTSPLLHRRRASFFCHSFFFLICTVVSKKKSLCRRGDNPFMSPLVLSSTHWPPGTWSLKMYLWKSAVFHVQEGPKQHRLCSFCRLFWQRTWDTYKYLMRR